MNKPFKERRSDRAFRYDNHSQAMAHKMIRRLGVAEAKRICLENRWNDVLLMINAED